MEPKTRDVLGLQKGLELASGKTSKFSPAFTLAYSAHLFHSIFWNSFIFFFFSPLHMEFFYLPICILEYDDSKTSEFYML